MIEDTKGFKLQEFGVKTPKAQRSSFVKWEGFKVITENPIYSNRIIKGDPSLLIFWKTFKIKL